MKDPKLAKLCAGDFRLLASSGMFDFCAWLQPKIGPWDLSAFGKLQTSD